MGHFSELILVAVLACSRSTDAPRCAADASSRCEELGEVSTLQVKGSGSRAVQAQAPEFVIPGLGPGGNPDPVLTVDDVTFDQETVSCTDPKWKPDANEVWTFEQIAESFLIHGAKKFYKPGTGPDPLTQCVGALITAAGECVPKLGIGCDARATGPSGVFQLDFLRSGGTGTGAIVNAQIKKDDGLMNLCISGFGAGFITATPWVDRANDKVATLQGDSFLTCMGAPRFVNNYSCPDPKAESGVLYPNFLGPFCHKGYASRWSPCKLESTSPRCCGVWNGGANDYQIPFPDYYLEKAQENLKAGADFEKTCQEALKKVSWGQADTESELEESTDISSRAGAGAGPQWAYGTSTQFGAGEAEWPSGTDPFWYIDRINSRTGPWAGTVQTFADGSTAIRSARTGAAIPWPTVMNYQMLGPSGRGRKAWINQTIMQAQGQLPDGPPLCYMVQPVKKGAFPFTEDGTPVDYNSEDVLAKSKTGKNYVYLVAPYEGCGGDGQASNGVGIQDVFNSCPSVQSLINALGKSDAVWYAEMAKHCGKDMKALCAAACSLWNGTGFTVLEPHSTERSEASGYDFVKDGSCALGVSLASEYGRNSVKATNDWVKDTWDVDLSNYTSCYGRDGSGHVNYCSGSNGHFDFAVDPSAGGFGMPWKNDYDASELQAMFGDDGDQNILLRWIPARCDAWGPWTPYKQECAASFCDFCTFGNPESCDRCAPGSEVQEDGKCSEMAATGTCEDLDLPTDNLWLKAYCVPSWSPDGTHRLMGGYCPQATTFCNCLDVIRLWAKPDSEANVFKYYDEQC